MSKKFQCPSCNGRGGEVEPVLDFGQGPWYDCGFCKGKGTVSRAFFFRVLGWVSAEKRNKRRRYLERLSDLKRLSSNEAGIQKGY